MKNYFFLLGVCIVLGSCSTGDGPAVSRMLGGSSGALAFNNCKAVSENEIEFVFSRAVTVKSVNFSPELPIASVENGSTVRITLEKNAVPGMPVTADLIAVDEKKNSINVLVSFRTRNNRMPLLQINELFTEYDNPKAEYIELKMKSDGNQGAMRVVIIGNSNTSKQTVYEFAPVEVKKDDYVVIHLRTLEESCKNEYSGNKAESGGTNSSPSAWDFWIPGTTKLMQKAATAVYVLDQDDKVLDAVMISEKDDSFWAKDYFTETANFLFEQGAWKSADGSICVPKDAVNTAAINTAKTRSICRNENAVDTNTATEWYVTASSGLSPGVRNR